MSTKPQDRERNIRDRIASQIQAAEHAPSKPVSPEDLQKLHLAANRLDQLLQEAADADREALKIAAARLDDLLRKIGKGKKDSHAPKPRQRKQK
jgi:uncharacterized membrane protein YccC